LKQLKTQTNYSAKLQIELYLIDVEHQNTKNYIESDVVSFVTKKRVELNNHKTLSSKFDKMKF